MGSLIGLNKQWEMVKAFHLKYNHPVGNSPRKLDHERVIKRYKWMMEEIDEFKSAKDVCDQVDAMIDLIYFALGTLVETGVKPEKLFSIVHTANMNKLWPDGNPHYDEDGKTIKPKSWEDPYYKIKEAIELQSPID